MRGKVKTAGFDISDEVAGSIMLCGLSDEYKPLIMSIEAKDKKITLDYVKNLLLQSVDFEDSNECALSVQNKNKKKNNSDAKNKTKKVKCFDCGGPHYKNKCPNKKEKTGKPEAADWTFSVFDCEENESVSSNFNSENNSNVTKNNVFQTMHLLL